jgi:hypothetical protein
MVMDLAGDDEQSFAKARAVHTWDARKKKYVRWSMCLVQAQMLKNDDAIYSPSVCVLTARSAGYNNNVER